MMQKDDLKNAVNRLDEELIDGFYESRYKEEKQARTIRLRTAIIAVAVALLIAFAAVTTASFALGADLPRDGREVVSLNGMLFEMNADGASYTLKDVTEKAGSEIVMPDAVNGLPVTAIGSGAMKNSRASSLRISKYVEYIAPGLTLNSALSRVSVDEDNPVLSNSGRNVVNKTNNSVEIGFEQTEDEVCVIGAWAYAGQTELRSMRIPDRVTAILDKAFYGCTSLNGISFPRNLAYIGASAFEGCRALHVLTLGLNHSVKVISSRAFKDCTTLESISLPASVSFIAEDAFEGCAALKNVVYYGSAAEWEKLTERFDSDNPLKKAEVYCDKKTPVRTSDEPLEIHIGTYTCSSADAIASEWYYKLVLKEDNRWLLIAFGSGYQAGPILHGEYTIDGETLVCGDMTFKAVAEGMLQYISCAPDAHSPIVEGAVYELEQEQTASKSRCFIREKDSSFNIYLRDDGSCNYSWGFLSSYIGMGTWSEENGILTITDNLRVYNTKDFKEYTDREFHYRFYVRDNALVYIKDPENSVGDFAKIEDGEAFLNV